MRLRLGALMMTLLLGLTACAGGQSASGLDAKYRSYYAALTGFSGRCTVTADYGTKVYEYELALAGDLTQGEAEVTAPENIAGVRFQWEDEDGALVYDGVTLETGELSPDNRSWMGKRQSSSNWRTQSLRMKIIGFCAGWRKVTALCAGRKCSAQV